MNWKKLKGLVIAEHEAKMTISDEIYRSINQIEAYITEKTPAMIHSMELLLHIKQNDFRDGYLQYKNSNELSQAETSCINEIYNQLMYHKCNSISREIFRWIMVYCACVLVIQCCTSWITSASQLFHVFNAHLLFNFIVWSLFCLILGIFCYGHRIINFKVSFLIVSVYLTFRLFDDLHPDWHFLAYKNIYYMDVPAGILLVLGCIAIFYPRIFRKVSLCYRLIFAAKEIINN